MNGESIMRPLLFALSAALLAAPTEMSAQACSASDSTEIAGFLDGVRSLASSTDPADVATRARIKLPHAVAAEVSFISDSSTCAVLLAAYQHAGGTDPEQWGTVRVARVRDVFFVRDPGVRQGEFSVAMVIDASGVVLGKFRY